MTGIALIEKNDHIRKALEAETGAEAPVRFDEPMSLHTSLHIGGPADMYVEPKSPETLIRVLAILKRAGFPSFPLGGGTNLLVRDAGIEGAVISLRSIDGIDIQAPRDEKVSVRVGAGVALQRLLGVCRREGLSGLESLSGIPGLVGGAVAGNAGSFGTEIKDVIETVELIDAEGGLITLQKEEMDFSYRTSSIPAGAFITAVELVLRKDDPEEIARRMDETLGKKRETQPLGEWSAGCVFKNPAGDSAGRLIDEAGCKGMHEGDVLVSEKHANFFINKGEGTADNFLRLMDMVGTRVEKASGIVLEPEIRVVGR